MIVAFNYNESPVSSWDGYYGLHSLTDWIDSTSNPEGWICNCGPLTPANSVLSTSLGLTEFKRRISAYAAQHTNFGADEWCAHNPTFQAAGMRYLGASEECYYVAEAQVAITLSSGRNRHHGQLLMDGDNPCKFDCPHCALKAAKEASSPAAASQGYRACVLACGRSTTLESRLPAPPETVGGPRPSATHGTVKDVLRESIGRSCGNCGRLGHNSRTCDKAAKAHAKVGIEIEGRWMDLTAMERMARDEGMTGCGDGSVNSGITGADAWEFQTSPGSLAHSLSQLLLVYPDEADKSCGMHVHISFNAATDVSLLATQAFFDYFRRRWVAWGEANQIAGRGENDRGSRGQFWARLFGENSYCRINNRVPTSITRIDRYHQLNFSAWGEHETVECRLLPMFRTASLAVSAVQELVDIYETFLADPEACGYTFSTGEIFLPESTIEPVVSTRELDTPEDLSVVVEKLLDVEEDIPALEEGHVRVFRGSVNAGATIRSVIPQLIAA